mmetsp:Transcript_23849/g.52581  ORF Transcript_23849/g.52581 Transcript_23849/m.52581 type:complete len:231 (+) Transcript_23849:44-736(+)|eukprot:CAMPEP_0204477448 /NCGR_PEP_ID=MMETSP0471-20130131/32039_1 /ASSEMBLY_ACC=CAM_ASM_000602 /TAXON_ID=2969 /ORGANISM="Oxyrrhis marina" /LENGTH=230 /DNA_ID=CAMNT_0051480181 /DNA_START=12 /DNA_END=704 /DNA_ORIENTATION=+
MADLEGWWIDAINHNVQYVVTGCMCVRWAGNASRTFGLIFHGDTIFWGAKRAYWTSVEQLRSNSTIVRWCGTQGVAFQWCRAQPLHQAAKSPRHLTTADHSFEFAANPAEDSLELGLLYLLKEQQVMCREDLLERRSRIAAFRFEPTHFSAELGAACRHLQRSCASRLALLFELDSVDWRAAACDADVLGPTVWEDLNLVGSRLSCWEFEVGAVEHCLDGIAEAADSVVS